MSIDIVSKPLEAYAEQHSEPESPLFRALAKETYRNARYPNMQVGHLEGRFLAMLVRLTRARRILEIGTFTGYSALSMAEAMPAGGRLTTLDIDPAATVMARRFWAKSPAGRRIRLILGPALSSLPSLAGPFDLVFIDANKTNYWNYWEACLPKVRKGGLIVVDNVLWSGKVLKPRDENDRAIVDFNRRVARDRRVVPVIVSIRDGVTLAYKK